MKVSELRKLLIAEGCNEDNFTVLFQGDDAFCLNKKDNEWLVCYSQMGCMSEPMLKSGSE